MDKQDYENLSKSFALMWEGRVFQCLKTKALVKVGGNTRQGDIIQVGDGYIVAKIGDETRFHGSIIEIID